MKLYAMGWCLSTLVLATAIGIGGGCGSDVVDFTTSSGASSGDTAVTTTSV